MSQFEISIPDAIDALAKRIAHQLGISRNEVFANAVAAYADEFRLSQELSAVQSAVQSATQSAVQSAVQSAQAEQAANAAAAVVAYDAPHRKTLTRHEAHLMLDPALWAGGADGESATRR